MRRSSAGGTPLLAVASGVVFLSFLVFGLMLGPRRAVSIAGAAFASTVIDGFAEDLGPHRIPVLDLAIDPAKLDTLETDLPWSGGRNMKAALMEEGVHHKVKFRYRGVVSPSHYLGDKKSFRLSMKRSNPFAPYRKVNVINPKAFNLINDHLANWVAGEMGVPVPYNELVFVRLNGKDHGVMELFEQVDGTFERSRHLTKKQVPVYKGDYPAIADRKLTKGTPLWQNAAYWEYSSKADSALAHVKLQALIAAMKPDTLSIASHRDSIAQLIDVDAFLRYEAALLVINTIHIDQYHNQWLVLNPRTGRFYPILWDALMMFAPPGKPLYPMHNAMTWWTMHVPEWRLQRDRYVYEALLRMQRDGVFEMQLDALVDRIRPSVLADRNKYGNVTLLPEDVHRVSLAHVVGSIASLRSSVSGYWDRTLQRLESNAVTVERGASLTVRSTSEAPLRLRWSGEHQQVQQDGQAIEPVLVDGVWELLLYRKLVPTEGGKDHPYADKQQLIVVPLETVIAFAKGVPATLQISNAITDGTIE